MARPVHEYASSHHFEPSAALNYEVCICGAARKLGSTTVAGVIDNTAQVRIQRQEAVRAREQQQRERAQRKFQLEALEDRFKKGAERTEALAAKQKTTKARDKLRRHARAFLQVAALYKLDRVPEALALIERKDTIAYLLDHEKAPDTSRGSGPAAAWTQPSHGYLTRDEFAAAREALLVLIGEAEAVPA